MRVIDLIQYLKQGISYEYYPNYFPVTSANNSAVIRLTGGATPGRVISKPSLQVLVRALHPADAEAKAWEIYNFLNQKRNFDVGATHVIFCVAQQSTPFYIGTDENGRFLYSVNFTAITEEEN